MEIIISLISSILSALAPELFKAWREKRNKKSEDQPRGPQDHAPNTDPSGKKDEVAQEDPAVRSFGDLVKNGKYATAVEVADIEKGRLIQSINSEDPNKQLILDEFDFWHSRALIYTGSAAKGIAILKGILDKYEPKTPGHLLPAGQRKRLLLGRAHNDIGYANWMEMGHYQTAIQELSAAVKYFAASRPESDELATACDNIGRVYAQMGHRLRAEFLIEHGRRIRLSLDISDRYALSLISSAISYLAFGDPYRALEISEAALREFKTGEKNRKVGLAKIIMGQALRRIGELWIYDRPAVRGKYVTKVDESIAILEEALQLFDPTSGGISEPIRQCQINNEMGCAYRERFFIERDTDDFDNAQKYLHKGLGIARAKNYVTAIIDGHEDLARLYAEDADPEVVSQAYLELDTAQKLIEETAPSSLIPENRAETLLDAQDCVEEMWHQLGKIYTLRAHLIFGKEEDPAPEGKELYKAIKYYLFAMGYFSLYNQRLLTKDVILERIDTAVNNKLNRKPELMCHRGFTKLLYKDLRKLKTTTLQQIAQKDIPEILAEHSSLRSEWVEDFFGDIAELLIETRP